jgi:hypothetical protein
MSDFVNLLPTYGGCLKRAESRDLIKIFVTPHHYSPFLLKTYLSRHYLSHS